jgi:uncharacterized protein (TIGR03437 family)
MSRLLTLTILCAAFLPCAFGQDASVNTIAAVGYLYPAPVALAPGQVITVFVVGNVQGDITATVRQVSDHPAPVLGVTPAPNCIIAPSAACSSTTAITIQIPYEIVPTCFVCDTPASFYTQLFITVNGAAGALFDLIPLTDHVHILTACDTAVPNGGGYAPYNGLPCAPLVTHADGSLVIVGNPAKGGEVVVAYAVGLGATTPAVPTGKAAATATPTSQTFSLDFNFRPNALATQPMPPMFEPVLLPTSLYTPLYSGLAPGFVGLYQINFIVPQPPAGIAACSGTVQSNLTVSVGGQYSFDGAGICVAPSE